MSEPRYLTTGKIEDAILQLQIIAVDHPGIELRSDYGEVILDSFEIEPANNHEPAFVEVNFKDDYDDDDDDDDDGDDPDTVAEPAHFEPGV